MKGQLSGSQLFDFEEFTITTFPHFQRHGANKEVLDGYHVGIEFVAGTVMNAKSAHSLFTPQVREILKRVDGLIKKEDLEGAQAAILEAKQTDPKNMYVHAYYERVHLLFEEHMRNREAEAALRKSEVDARLKAEAERKQWLAEETKRKLALVDDRVQQSKKTPPSVHTPIVVAKPAVSKRSRALELAEYSRALYREWAAGVPDAEANKRLDALRTSLAIAKEEHDELETAARRECYISAFKELWSSKFRATDGPSTITALHRKFGLSMEECEMTDLDLLTQVRIPKTRPQLVVIDDDKSILMTMTDVLTDNGFDVRPFDTSDEAYRFLLHATPDLILADVNLESSTMGGFAFFQKIQEIPRLSGLPFIFVSGLTDEVVIRAGKELGADDYITKPFAGETLVSTIKGKLRRYHELRKRAN